MYHPQHTTPQPPHVYTLRNATIGGESRLQAHHSISADRRSASGTPAIHLPAAVPLDATVSAGFAPGSWTPPATPAWSPPVGSSAEPSQQPQRQDPYPGCLFTNPPYQPLLGAQARVNTFRQTPDVCSSNRPGSQLQNTPGNAPNISPGAQVSAQVLCSIPGQNTYVSSTISEQSIGETNSATFDDSPTRPVSAPLIENSGSPVQALPARYGIVQSLTVPTPNGNAKHCVCTNKWWFAWCPRALEHCAFVYYPWPIHHPCVCGWALSTPQLPRCCPKVANHLLDWLSAPKNIRLSQLNAFENASVNHSIAPGATYNNPQYIGAGSVAPPYRNTYDPHEGETQEFRLCDTNHSTPFRHTSPLSFASPFTLGTPVTTQESQPTDVDRNLHLIAVALDPTIAGSDAGPSRNRDIESEVDVVDESPDFRDAEVDEADEGPDFRDTDLPPEIRQAMRLLVNKILESTFIVNQTLEPSLGTLDASALMAVAPSELWIGYGTKGKSIYSLFIRVDGDDCECLWCGDVQHGKLLRAIGHFRAKHLGHKPFTCDLAHADEKVCHARFSTSEAMTDHQKKKKKQGEQGRLPCADCGHSYISTSNLNRHKCFANLDAR